MLDHDEDKQNLEECCRNREEIDGDQFFEWFFRNVRQVCDGGFGCRTMYLLTEDSEIWIPSLRSSLWILGAPQPTLSRLRVRMRSRVSLGTAGRPGCPWRTFQVQYQRKPRRCQSITVSGFTIQSASRYRDEN